MGPCTPSACMGPTCSRGPFRHDEDLPKYFKIGDSGRIRPFCRIQSPVGGAHCRQQLALQPHWRAHDHARRTQ